MLNLMKDSEMLSEITDLFEPLRKRFNIYNFWEGLPTTIGNKKSFVVHQDSAASPWHESERCAISATHSDMVKFHTQSSPGYRVVYEALKRYIGSATVSVPVRWAEESKILQFEREKEAEALMAPQLDDYEAETNVGINQWFMVPRCSSHYFTGREKYSQIVKQKLGLVHMQRSRAKHQVFVMFGLGGSGKTQFCLKYVEQVQSRCVQVC